MQVTAALGAAIPSVVAGTKDHAGYVNASGASARFNQPYGIFVNPDGTLLVADQRNGAVRKITSGVVSTVVKNSNLVHMSNLARTSDGAIAVNNGGTTVLYKNGILNPIHKIGCPHCNTGGVSKSADSSFFWYADNLYDFSSVVYLESIRPDGTFGAGAGGAIAESDDENIVAATAVSTTLNDNKFITLTNGVYEVTHAGAVVNILSPTTFGNLTDIAANKDGTKLYVADQGDIKLITRCASCPTKLTVVASHVDASGLALSNSEKVLFFTSSKHHTVNKINLP
ncbi:hypothetical protein [Mucilaginibacter aquaedulcis]|uniref:hypothetical protein n=1 Tax=Mucilaginibacter aquaedulcis TaxID=1187081 RepID=UPI0025B54689|nr:hypothetical protein [Mucilaginibacter aquaedulcis]MDN3548362.1 hypothetical protein [Mucilaginibacter aquaedulcis]